MAILVNRDTRVLVQGITGREGNFHTKAMLDYGTKVVAGVTPGKGGSKVHGLPVYDLVSEAVSDNSINTSIIFVPPRSAVDSLYEAVDAGIKLVVVITEGIPLHEELKAIEYARSKEVIVIGPNCPGIISPSLSKVGIMPAMVFKQGSVAVISRSGTLTYEVAYHISTKGPGISTALGIGGDPIIGLTFKDVLQMLQKDDQTKGVALIGEIGGSMEEEAAAFIGRGEFNKPVVAYIAGRTAPPEKKMGHAGAIVSMGSGSAQDKILAFKGAGVPVAETPMDVAALLKEKV